MMYLKSALLLSLLVPTVLSAQGVRINGVSTARYIEVRPYNLESDTPSVSKPLGLVPLTQDLHVNAWGFGQGIRLYAHVRARASVGDAQGLWPQADDEFDALSAYLEIDRSLGRARVGRQWTSSHLGFYNFDGATLLVRPWNWLTAEIYGGWALAPGLNEFITSDALAAVEPFAPDRRSNLIGAQLRLRDGNRVTVGGEYQREIRTDRAGLYGERAAADATLQLHGASLEGSIETDLSKMMLNEGRLRLTLPTWSGFRPSLEARRYKPYFQLWTIWGAFAPVGFDEASALLGWSTRGQDVSITLRGGWRTYHDDGTTEEVFGGLVNDGWRAGVNAWWQATPRVSAWGNYQADINFGASRSAGDVGIRLELGRSGYLSASAIAFQTAHELQVRDGTVFGLSTDAGLRLGAEAQLSWNLALYRHLNTRGFDAVDWNQLRATMQLDWSIGSDPGRTAAARRTS